jgi:hypothetical protein
LKGNILFAFCERIVIMMLEGLGKRSGASSGDRPDQVKRQQNEEGSSTPRPLDLSRPEFHPHTSPHKESFHSLRKLSAFEEKAKAFVEWSERKKRRCKNTEKDHRSSKKGTLQHLCVLSNKYQIIDGQDDLWKEAKTLEEKYYDSVEGEDR